MATRIYIADVAALHGEETFRRLHDQVPTWRRDKVDRYLFMRDKCLSLGVGLLLRQACADFGVPFADEHVTLGENGKAALRDHPQVAFNLSHSIRRVMCAMTDDVGVDAIGCDVERIESLDWRVARRVYRPEEQEWLKGQEALGREAGELAFYRLWTVKESFMKALGTGFTLPPETFSVRMGEWRDSRAIGRAEPDVPAEGAAVGHPVNGRTDGGQAGMSSSVSFIHYPESVREDAQRFRFVEIGEAAIRPSAGKAVEPSSPPRGPCADAYCQTICLRKRDGSGLDLTDLELEVHRVDLGGA